jgi:hypothetical protein
MGQLVEAFGYFDEARRCVVRAWGLVHRRPLHQFVGLAIFRYDGGFGLISVFLL